MAQNKYKILVEADITNLKKQLSSIESQMDNALKGGSVEVDTSGMLKSFKKTLKTMKEDLAKLNIKDIELGKINQKPLLDLQENLKEVNNLASQLNTLDINIDFSKTLASLETLQTKLKETTTAINALNGSKDTNMGNTKGVAKSAKEVQAESNARIKAIEAEAKAKADSITAQQKLAQQQARDEQALAKQRASDQQKLIQQQTMNQQKLAQKQAENDLKVQNKQAAEAEQAAKKEAQAVQKQADALRELESVKKSMNQDFNKGVDEVASLTGKVDEYYRAISKIKRSGYQILDDKSISSVSEAKAKYKELNAELKALQNNKSFNLKNSSGELMSAGTVHNMEQAKTALMNIAKQYGSIQGDSLKISNSMEKLSVNVVDSTGKMTKLSASIDQVNNGLRIKDTVDTSGVSKYTECVQQLTNAQARLQASMTLDKSSDFLGSAAKLNEYMRKIGDTFDGTDLKGFKEELKFIDSEMRKLYATEEKLQASMKNSTILSGVGSFDQSVQGFKNIAQQMGTIQEGTFKIDEATGKMTTNIKQADGTVKQLSGSFDSVNSRLTATVTSSVRAQTAFEKMGAVLAKMGQTYAMYFGMHDIFAFTSRHVREGWEFVQEMDRQLTTINSTMPVTKSELAKLGDQSIKTAQDLGASVDSVMNVAEIYANTQESVESILDKTKPTVKLSNAGGMDSSAASDVLQGITMQYSELQGQEDRVVDSIEKISANLKLNFGTGIEWMADALGKTGSIANQAGMEFEKVLALSGKISEVTRQTGDVTGNSLKC